MNNWSIFFKNIQNKEYAKKIKVFLDDEYNNYNIFPERKNIFKAFQLTKPQDIKIIIIGQDPYCQIGQATGLAFSVDKNQKIPPSLENIFKEIESEYNLKMKQNGDLTYLANRGCFLLNTILTVRENRPLSHDINEYKDFIKDVLEYIDNLEQYIVFLLWGSKAKQYTKYIKNKRRLVLLSAHPSPLSANRGGWFGNNHFLKANTFLEEHGIKGVDWKND
ncbi:MAG: uracil-DNA glycosylase [Bacilli bacterium]|nr:uracil-DNA glycosylase [Bacilli bacterium]